LRAADEFIAFFGTTFNYIIDEFITGPTARTQQFTFEAVTLKAVIFEAVTLKAVTFKAVTLEAVTFKAVAFEAVAYVAVPP
jgi:Pentapeptide repeats (9 copies)